MRVFAYDFLFYIYQIVFILWGYHCYYCYFFSDFVSLFSSGTCKSNAYFTLALFFHTALTYDQLVTLGDSTEQSTYIETVAHEILPPPQKNFCSIILIPTSEFIQFHIYYALHNSIFPSISFHVNTHSTNVHYAKWHHVLMFQINTPSLLYKNHPTTIYQHTEAISHRLIRTLSLSF